MENQITAKIVCCTVLDPDPSLFCTDPDTDPQETDSFSPVDRGLQNGKIPREKNARLQAPPSPLT
jgi:hypothetical protein